MNVTPPGTKYYIMNLGNYAQWLLDAVEGGNDWSAHPRVYGEKKAPLTNNKFNQLDGRYWRDLSHTLSGMLRWSGARPRPSHGERFKNGVHGYGMDCDAGAGSGWIS